MAVGYSVRLPFSLSPDDGAYALNKTLASVVRQNIKMVILTSPGERVMDSDFGVGIRNYLFESMTGLVMDSIQFRIISQLNKYLPFVNLVNVEVSSNEESPNTLYIRVEYSFPSSSTQVLDLKIT